MGRLSRRMRLPVLEHLEERTLLSTTHALHSAVAGAAAISPPPVKVYRTPAVLAQAGTTTDSSDPNSAQTYFNSVKKLTDPTPQPTLDANVSDWNALHTTATLNAYATYAGTDGDQGLTYTWSVDTAPPGGASKF